MNWDESEKLIKRLNEAARSKDYLAVKVLWTKLVDAGVELEVEIEEKKMNDILILLRDRKLTDAAFNVHRVDKKEISLFYSKLGTWTKPGDLAYTLIKSDDDWYFHDHLLKKKFRIDVCQLEALLTLCKLMGENVEYKLFKEVQNG